jgi:hypothetical protein
MLRSREVAQIFTIRCLCHYILRDNCFIEDLSVSRAVSSHCIHSLFICWERTIAHSKHCPAYQQFFPTVECKGSAVPSCLEFHGMGIRCGKQALVKKTNPRGHSPSDFQRHSDESDKILRLGNDEKPTFAQKESSIYLFSADTKQKSSALPSHCDATCMAYEIQKLDQTFTVPFGLMRPAAHNLYKNCFSVCGHGKRLKAHHHRAISHKPIRSFAAPHTS